MDQTDRKPWSVQIFAHSSRIYRNPRATGPASAESDHQEGAGLAVDMRK